MQEIKVANGYLKTGWYGDNLTLPFILFHIVEMFPVSMFYFRGNNNAIFILKKNY
jgi:hypothetical protein